MTLTTTFVNKTNLDFKLKEGDSGVYKDIGLLVGLKDPDAEPSSITLKFDQKSTYKEYKVVQRVMMSSRSGRTSAQQTKLLVGSDYIMDHSTIYIIPHPDNPGAYKIEGDSRTESSKADASSKVSSIWVALKSKVFKRT
jgi:hypothetical protein